MIEADHQPSLHWFW